MTEQDRITIKLDIWREMMRRVQQYYPQQQGFIAGGQQWASVTPVMQPLDAAKQVQAVFDTLYPQPKKARNR